MIVRSFLLLFSLLLPVSFTSVYANTHSEQIHNSVLRYMQQYKQDLITQYDSAVRVEFEISNVDPRISLADCPQPLSIKRQSNRSIGRINIKVSCTKESAWSIYVPVNIKLYREVVVTTTPLDRQVKLSYKMLRLRDVDVSQLRGTYFTDTKQIIGMQTTRPLRPDIPITARQIEPPIMIKKGESILITANSNMLVVKMPGTALMDGRVGQQIRVQNKQSKRIIEAKVTAPGQVMVPM